MNKKFFSLSRENMIKNQIITNQVIDQDLINAFSEVDKEKFVPPSQQPFVYSDSNILISENRYLMKTFTFAKMLQNCSIKKTDSILIIGCLTGYSVAILSKIAGYVFGVENDKKIVEKANKTLIDMGYLNCSVVTSNLVDGLKKNSPFDKIIIEGGVDYVPDNILDQLRNGGKIFLMQRKPNNVIYEFTMGLKSNGNVSFRPIFSCNSVFLDAFKK